MRDLKRLQSDPPQGVQGSPLDNNVSLDDDMMMMEDDETDDDEGG